MNVYISSSFLHSYKQYVAEQRESERPHIHVNLIYLLDGAAVVTLLDGSQSRHVDPSDVLIMMAQDVTYHQSADVHATVPELPMDEPVYCCISSDADSSLYREISFYGAQAIQPSALTNSMLFETRSVLELYRHPSRTRDLLCDIKGPTTTIHIVDRYLISCGNVRNRERVMKQAVCNVLYWYKLLVQETEMKGDPEVVIVCGEEGGEYVGLEEFGRALRAKLPSSRRIKIYQLPLYGANPRDVLHDRHIWTTRYHLVSTKGWLAYDDANGDSVRYTTLIVSIPLVRREYYDNYKQVRGRIYDLIRQCPKHMIWEG